MKVYKLTPEQNAAWSGIYNGNGFGPIEDANGNFVVGLECGDNENYPFVEDLKLCEQIDFEPKPTSL